MRAKLVTMGMTFMLALALVFELSAALALAQEGTTQSTANANASKPRRTKSRAKRTRPATPASETAAPAEQSTPEAAAPTSEAKPPQRASRRRRTGGRRMMRGVPTGVQNCLDHLIEMASADPLIPYEGHPQEIINNGLLWNDPQSKCSVAADASLRGKVFDVATAWRMNDAAKVRSLLQEIKSAAPQN